MASPELLRNCSEEGACLTVKNIGKPCAGKSHARIDEGRLMNGVLPARLLDSSRMA